MAAPSYSTDLQLVTNADSGTWAELAGHLSGAAPSADTEAYLEGLACMSQATGQAIGTTAGMQFDYGANLSWTAGFVVLFWQMFAAPNNIDSWANGGMRVGIGSASGAMKFWNALGNDLSPYPYGGWQNTAVDPTFAADLTEGAPAAGAYRVFGSLPNMLNKITKGSPHCVDAIRFGRGQIRATLGDLANGYATFAGLAAANDAATARWGLFSNRAGSFLWKGLLSFGLAGTAVDFRDSNKIINLDDTPRVYAGFNKIEIRNVASRVDLTSVSINAPTTSITGAAPISQGDFEVVDNADVNLDGCTFTDMGSFIFKANTAVVGCTFRRCGQITQNQASFAGGLITRCDAAVAMVSDNPGAVTGVEFVSTGTGHAMQITVPGTYTLTQDIFTGYAAGDGSTGNEAIYNNSGGLVTLNISGGNTPSVRNGAGASTVVNNTITLSLTGLVDGSDIVILNAGTSTERINIDQNAGSTYNFGFSTGGNVDICVYKQGYVPFVIRNYTLPASNGSVPINQVVDRNFLD